MQAVSGLGDSGSCDNGPGSPRAAVASLSIQYAASLPRLQPKACILPHLAISWPTRGMLRTAWSPSGRPAAGVSICARSPGWRQLGKRPARKLPRVPVTALAPPRTRATSPTKRRTSWALRASLRRVAGSLVTRRPTGASCKHAGAQPLRRFGNTNDIEASGDNSRGTTSWRSIRPLVRGGSAASQLLAFTVWQVAPECGRLPLAEPSPRIRRCVRELLVAWWFLRPGVL